MKRFSLLLVVIALFISVSAQKKAGFLNVAPTASAITDDDELAAAQWFTTTYGGDYIAASAIKDGSVDPSQYGVIWIYCNNDVDNSVPQGILDIVPQLETYYKAGGNLFLCTFANNLLSQFGRVDIAPENVNVGACGENPDDWQLSTSYGTNAGLTTVDISGDPLFAGLTTQSVVRGNGNTYYLIPFISAGCKENHNCFWSMGGVIPNDQYSKLTTWQTTFNVEALGSWGQVSDYFGAAVARWKPTTDFKGICITMGVAAYQFAMTNGETNNYQANITRFSQNALDELSGVHTGVKSVTESDIKVNVSNNTLTVQHADAVGSLSMYNVGGSLVNTFNAKSINSGIDISTLANGVYILRMNDKAGNAIVNQKFIK